MNIDFCSDLHLEFKPIILPESNADVLVLAGDIGLISMILQQFKAHNDYGDEFGIEMYRFFEDISNRYKHVIYVMGNHEYYRGDLADINKLKHELKIFPNIKILENESIVIDGIKFMGGTMWTNINNRNPNIIARAAQILNDFRLITVDYDRRYTAFDWLDNYDRFIEFYNNEDKNEYPTIVITHHSPSYYSILDMYKSHDNANALYCSSNDNITKGTNIKYWIHGHLHGSYGVQMDNCSLVSNTRGYPGEHCFGDFKLKTIEM